VLEPESEWFIQAACALGVQHGYLPVLAGLVALFIFFCTEMRVRLGLSYQHSAWVTDTER
jgi:hypothetical protein